MSNIGTVWKLPKKKIPFSRFLGVQKQKMSISAFTQIDKDEGEIVSHNLMVLCKMKKKKFKLQELNYYKID